MSGLLIGILALIGGTQRYIGEDTLTREIEGGGTITFPEGTPLVSVIMVPPTPLPEAVTVEPVTLPNEVRVDIIERLSEKIPDWVEERWTESERGGNVIYGREEEIWKEHAQIRSVGGMEIIDV